MENNTENVVENKVENSNKKSNKKGFILISILLAFIIGFSIYLVKTGTIELAPTDMSERYEKLNTVLNGNEFDVIKNDYQKYIKDTKVNISSKDENNTFKFGENSISVKLDKEQSQFSLDNKTYYGEITSDIKELDGLPAYLADVSEDMNTLYETEGVTFISLTVFEDGLQREIILSQKIS